MNANLITDLEVIRDKLASLELYQKFLSDGTIAYEIQQAKIHVERAIEWAKTP